MQVLDNYNYFGYMKGANEVNRQYFQQAVLLCLLKALYCAGICSYAACIILCPKLCWHNSPRPKLKAMYVQTHPALTLASYTVVTSPKTALHARARTLVLDST